MKIATTILRRHLLAAVAVISVATVARARVIFGGRPFARETTAPPTPVDRTDGWNFFTPAEAEMIEAIVDRLIPPDDLGIGGREAGCAIFIDRQLAGDYGRSTVWYRAGPQRVGTPQQGPQFTDTIAERYRNGLKSLSQYCATNEGKAFHALDPARQDELLAGLEDGSLRQDDVSGPALFEQILKNTREGYFADPLYGGNKDMAGWRMIGFPGARYDYRDLIARRGEDLQLEPIALYGNASAKVDD